METFTKEFTIYFGFYYCSEDLQIVNDGYIKEALTQRSICAQLFLLKKLNNTIIN